MTACQRRMDAASVVAGEPASEENRTRHP